LGKVLTFYHFLSLFLTGQAKDEALLLIMFTHFH